MATIYKSDLTKELIYSSGLATSRDIVPSQIADKVVPVVETNPKILKDANIVFSSAKGESGGSSPYTTSASKDTYITTAMLGFVKNAACDMANDEITITCIINGAAKSLVSLPCLTLTAQEMNEAITFPHPIKVDRNTAISFRANTFTAGACVRTMAITGFEIESNA